MQKIIELYNTILVNLEAVKIFEYTQNISVIKSDMIKLKQLFMQRDKDHHNNTIHLEDSIYVKLTF